MRRTNDIRCSLPLPAEMRLRFVDNYERAIEAESRPSVLVVFVEFADVMLGVELKP
jgi:hypothetical protein